MKKILIITFLFFQSQLNAEEYVGSIILSDSTIYTFELNLIINKENITGYSITNYGTSSETKSSIEGTFDKTKNEYVIIEKQIIYTKSKESIKNFCHLRIDLSEKGSYKSKRLEGEFIGYYDNNKKYSAISLNIAFGREKFSSGFPFVPSAPYFFSLFPGEKEPMGKFYKYKYWKNTSRHVCVSQGITEGELITTEFNLKDNFTKIWNKNMPTISGFLIAINSNAKSKAFIQKILFLR